MDDRVLPLRGIHNFRDYGGYAARGGRLRAARLWRSGHHFGATADDLEAVNALKIASVTDLRGDGERAKFPCLRHEEFQATVLFHPGETSGSRGKAMHEEWAGRVRTAADAHAAMVRGYTRMPFGAVLCGTMRLHLQELARQDGATLLHCLAGKDRTGITVAIVHGLLGVHPDDIMADYLLSNTAGDSDARIAAGAQNLRDHGATSLDEAGMRMLMSVQPEFLDAMFGAIREQYGSLETYAAELLGAGPDRVVAMEARLIE